MSVKKKIINEVKNYTDILLDLEIAIYVNNIVPIKKGNIDRVTWSSLNQLSKKMFYLEVDTYQTYEAWLRNQDYSLILYDASFVQITYEINKDNILSHRLVYYPCPYILNDELLELIKIDPVLDVLTLLDKKNLKLISPIRFDYDNREIRYHSKSHLTLNTPTCRIPVKAPISPSQFFEFIIKYFYHDYWIKYNDILKSKILAIPPTILKSDMDSMYIYFN